MKKYYIFAGIALLAASPGFAQIKIGATGAPDGSAMLEVTSGTANNKGLLPPRMTTVQRDAITSPATGLLIYNTTANEVQVNTGTAAAPDWTAATADNAGWSTTGNTGTDAASSFIGTTDNQPLAFRTNDTEAMRVTANGRIGIGTNAPVAKLQVVDTGNAAIVVTSSDDGKTSFNLGNINHGITRDLTDVGGVPNDVALFTTMANANDPASIHLAVRKDVNDTLDMNQFVLKNTGDVGIGTNTPIAKLSVVDTGNAAIVVTNAEDGKVSFNLQNGHHGLTKNLAEEGGSGNDVALFTTMSNLSDPASIHLAVRKDVNDTLDMNQFVLKNTGDVGIGTNTPIAKLSVVDTGYAAIVVSNADGGKASFNLQNGHHGLTKNLAEEGGSGNDVALFTTMGNPSDPASIHLAVRADISDTLDLNQFVLKNTGNVGIGTNEPVVKLQVVDTANAAIIVSNVDGSSKTSVYLGNENHGITRDLSEVGGKPNDVALFTTSGSSTTPIPADIHLSVRATSNDTLDMNQFVLKGTGRVGIGTNDPEYRLDVAGDINASGLVRSNGIALTSDVRLKRNIINTQYGLSTIMKLRPVEYEKKNSIKDNEYNRHEIGFIAQEIAKVLPGLVTEGKDADKTLAVSYTELIPVLTKAIQEQQAAIEALQAENKALKENKVVTVQLMERVKQMEQMLGLNEMELGAKVAGK